LPVSVAPAIFERMFEYEWDVAPPVMMLMEHSPAELLEHLAGVRPGPWMLGVLHSLREACELDADCEALLAAWDRFIAWAMLQRAHAVVGAATPHDEVPGPFGIDDLGPEFVAHVTGQTVSGAGNDLRVARTILDDLDGCYSALSVGQITWQMAREVADATSHLQVWQRQTVDERMVTGHDIDRDITRWRRRLRREVLRVDEIAEVRRRRAVAARNVASWPLPDGMACVRAELRAQDAATVMAALTAVADKYAVTDRAGAAAAAADANAIHNCDGAEGDERCCDLWIDPQAYAELGLDPSPIRTLDQRRADALVDVCRDTLADPTLPRRQGRRPTIQATGGIRTLLGLRNDPGELAGYGPITAGHLREIAADGEWQRFLTAPDTGALIAIGTDKYRPGPALREFMIGASPTCDFPGCSIPARRCDGEHTLAHDDGGETDEDNVRPRCRRHHRCKTHAGWRVEILPDHRVQWTTPAGTRRILAPYQLAGDEDDDADADNGHALRDVG